MHYISVDLAVQMQFVRLSHVNDAMDVVFVALLHFGFYVFAGPLRQTSAAFKLGHEHEMTPVQQEILVPRRGVCVMDVLGATQLCDHLLPL